MNTKLILLPVLLMTTVIAAAQSKAFTIKGNIKGKTGAWIYLMYTYDDGVDNVYRTDSALIDNGRFSFKGEITGPNQAMVAMEKNVRSFYDKYVLLYIAPGDMQLSLNYDNFTDGAVLKGSPVQDIADGLNKSKAVVMNKLKPLNEAYNKANEMYVKARKEKKDDDILDSLKNEAEKVKVAMEPYYDQLRKIDMSFMDKYPASYVTASMLRMYISRMPVEEGEARYNKLPDHIKSSGIGHFIKSQIDGLRAGSAGSKAYIFASTELRGAQLNFVDYKGKYVLLDFWASWCVPCRRGNPHLLSLYSKYKDKGLEIISISDDDRNPDAWQKAVEKDKIGVWKHILRGLKETPNGGFDRSADISDRYGINSLPTKILIDPNGIIIGRYGGGGEGDEAMDKKLSQIFGS